MRYWKPGGWFKGRRTTLEAPVSAQALQMKFLMRMDVAVMLRPPGVADAIRADRRPQTVPQSASGKLVIL